jgi:2,3-bisphosphoglycerate-dependent phosphoglycerate mutase
LAQGVVGLNQVELYFIRHAQSQNNALWAQTGSWDGRNADPELTPVGWQQARLLAEFLQQQDRDFRPRPSGADPHNRAGFGFTHLYCSLMVRAVATGTVLAGVMGRKLVAWPDLHEAGGIHEVLPETGERRGLPGHNRAYFETRFPAMILPDTLGAEGWWNRPPEPHEARPGRAHRVWGELLERHGLTDDRVAVISHGGFFNYLLGSILNTSVENAPWFAMNNAALTRIDYQEGEVVIQYTNFAPFLPAALVT